MGEPVRIGIVGVGTISKQYLDTLDRLESVVVTAVADIDEQLARTVAGNLTDVHACNLPELVSRDDVDLVLNLTIPVAHRDIALQAIRGGKSVYGEKPLALDTAQAGEMLAAATAAGVVIGCAPDTVLELARDPRIAGVKEASGSLEQACEILRARPTGFSVLSGEDSLALPIAACGGDGVIAVVSNEAPALLVELVASALAGDRSNAAALQARLLPLMKANFRESNPIPVKWALERLGLVGGALRLPLVPLSPAHHGPLEEALKVAGLLDEAGRPVEAVAA